MCEKKELAKCEIDTN